MQDFRKDFEDSYNNKVDSVIQKTEDLNIYLAGLAEIGRGDITQSQRMLLSESRALVFNTVKKLESLKF